MRLLTTSALILSLAASARAEVAGTDAGRLFFPRVDAAQFMSLSKPCSAQDAVAHRAEPRLADALSTARLDAKDSSASLDDNAFQADAQPLHAAVVEHSDAYLMRMKIHKIASFATLPLFAAEVALGQSLYNSPSDSRKGPHIAVGAGIMSLFAVNTVTGAWNLFGEDRREPKGRALRLVHGLLMMAADAGFVATAATGPHQRRNELVFSSVNASTHRAIALSSIGTGTLGYLVMLLGNR